MTDAITLEDSSDDDYAQHSTSSESPRPSSSTSRRASSSAGPAPKADAILLPRGILFGGDGMRDWDKKSSSPQHKLKDKLDKEEKRGRPQGSKSKKQLRKEKKMSESELRALRQKESFAATRKLNSGNFVKAPKKSVADKKEAVFAARTLPFASKTPATLEYGKGKTRLTKPMPKLIRKKKKSKKRDREESSSSENSSSEEGEREYEEDLPDDVYPRFKIADVAGGEHTAIRAIIASPSFKLPWAWNQISHPKSYDGAMPLLLLHKDALENIKAWEKVGGVVTHTPERAGGSERLNARFWMIWRHDSAKRVFLRIVICSATAEPGSWEKVENVVWCQDFPLQTSPSSGTLPTGYESAFTNPTHTEFSHKLVEFLFNDLQLPKAAEYASFAEPLGQVNFSASDKIRLVHSLAGTFETDEEIEKAGGLVSLAKAVSELKTFDEGTWKIEYASSHSAPLSLKFLERFWRACQGVDPRDTLTEVERPAEDDFHLLWPTQLWVENAENKPYLMKQSEVLHWTEAKEGVEDAREQVFHNCDTRSGRVSTTELLVISHSPLEGSSKCHEVFFLTGSHSFSQGSWGHYEKNKVVLKYFELSVLAREQRKTAEELNTLINVRVGYERPADTYDSDDEPFREMPEPAEPKKRRKKDE